MGFGRKTGLLRQKTSRHMAKTGQWLFKWLMGEMGKKVAVWGHFVPVAYFPLDLQPLHLTEKLLEIIVHNIFSINMFPLYFLKPLFPPCPPFLPEIL